MDHRGALHRRVQTPPTYLSRVTPSRPYQRHDLGRGSSGMAGPRLLVGQILDFTLASSKGHGQIEEEGEGHKGLCSRAISRADEERDS